MKISIITVCYNSANTIANTIESLNNQSYKDVEHIIVDGGSADATLSIIKDCALPNSNIVSEKDDGIYDAMNKGLGMASGDIVGFINSDDYYASRDILALVADVFKDDSIDCCYGDLCYVEQKHPNMIVRYWQSAPFLSNSFRRGWCPPHPTFFVRRTIYKKYGGFNLNYRLAADFELMARFLEIYRIQSFYLPKVMVRMRLGGATNRSIGNIFKQNYEIFKSLKELSLRPSFSYLFLNKFFTKLMQYFQRPIR